MISPADRPACANNSAYSGYSGMVSASSAQRTLRRVSRRTAGGTSGHNTGIADSLPRLASGCAGISGLAGCQALLGTHGPRRPPADGSPPVMGSTLADSKTAQIGATAGPGRARRITAAARHDKSPHGKTEAPSHVPARPARPHAEPSRTASPGTATSRWSQAPQIRAICTRQQPRPLRRPPTLNRRQHYEMKRPAVAHRV